MASAGGTVRKLEYDPVRHMKEISYGGLSVASGSFPKGSSVRIKTQGRKVKR